MPAEVTEILDGIAGDGEGGIYETKTYHVIKLEGAQEQWRFEALRATGVPRDGAGHPVDSEDTNDLIVKNRSVTLGPTINDEGFIKGTAEVSVQWGAKEEDQIHVSTSLQTVTTFRDFEGNEVLLNHKFKDPVSGDEVPDREIVDQGVEMQTTIPVTVKRFRRIETEDPANFSEEYINKVNFFDFLEQPSEHWLCTDISGSSSDGSKTFSTIYEFTLAKDQKDFEGNDRSGWDQAVRVRDPKTKEPIPDAALDVGNKMVIMHEAVDFGVLGFEILPTAIP